MKSKFYYSISKPFTIQQQNLLVNGNTRLLLPRLSLRSSSAPPSALTGNKVYMQKESERYVSSVRFTKLTSTESTSPPSISQNMHFRRSFSTPMALAQDPMWHHNMAFFFTTLAYMNTDMLLLRSFSIISGATLISYHYFRPLVQPRIQIYLQPYFQPYLNSYFFKLGNKTITFVHRRIHKIWNAFGNTATMSTPQEQALAIRWNLVLVAINSVMAVSLGYQRYKANHLGREMEKLYRDGEFEKRGFSRDLFVKFFEVGKRVKLGGEQCIAEEGKEMTKLFYVMEGTATVTHSSTPNKSTHGGQKIGTIFPHDFIGEMTFLFYCSVVLQEEDGRERESQPNKKMRENYGVKASATVVPNGEMTVWEWDSKTLAHALKEDRELSNAFSAYCNHDLMEKLLMANDLFGR